MEEIVKRIEFPDGTYTIKEVYDKSSAITKNSLKALASFSLKNPFSLNLCQFWIL